MTIFYIFLGDAFILVIIKTMQYNMLHTKDRYLHTNCLATLANMSNKFINLHPYVCQKLIGFYSTLVKRHSKTMEKLQLSVIKGEDESEGESVASHIANVSHLAFLKISLLFLVFRGAEAVMLSGQPKIRRSEETVQ